MERSHHWTLARAVFYMGWCLQPAQPCTPHLGTTGRPFQVQGNGMGGHGHWHEMSVFCLGGGHPGMA